MSPSAIVSSDTSRSSPTTPAPSSSADASSLNMGAAPATEDATPRILSVWEKEEEVMRSRREKQDAKQEAEWASQRQRDLEGGEEAVEQKFKGLDFLLKKSKLYATIMLAKMQRQEEEEEARDEKSRRKAQRQEEGIEKGAATSQRRTTRAAAGSTDSTNQGPPESQHKVLPTRIRGPPSRKPKGTSITDYFKKEDVQKNAAKGSVTEALQEAVESDVKASDMGIQNLQSARQPGLVTGGTMRPYQLEGLEWLISLYENGLNGILADEMGLGKTIQTISFLAFLREQKSYGPFLIAAPLSTTSNWVAEIQKWTPSIPVILYHGSKKEREGMRKKKLRSPGTPDFPVVVTSYEICMNDRKFLAGFGWSFIIIDEGHRIKNLNCRLIRELQSYQSANRLLITGTPLQNNLAELWSLLHFLMPSVFDSLEGFEAWFDFSALKDQQSYEQVLSEERKQKLVASIHAILKPFLLRRVKADVEKLLPRKREYVLFAPLTPMQRELYQAILDGTSRSYLEEKAAERIAISSGIATPRSSSSRSSLKRKATDSNNTNIPNKSAKSSREGTPASGTRGRRKVAPKSYEELSDAKYFARLEAAAAKPEPVSPPPSASDEEELTYAATQALAKKQIASKKLQNPVMQLRLCCDSPLNFFDPFASPVDGTELPPDESLITTSGKMLLLDSLLPALIEGGHKVLIFSQFKTQLDLLERYTTSLRGWPVARIDGSVPQAERQAQILAFNRPIASSKKPATAKRGRSRASTTSAKGSEEDEAPVNIFLLSTRAGGQGINLAAADTVILFDSDWNPQQDLQAQDRAHRIGQTRNVIVYRLATRNTVEQTLLDAAEGKRRLEKLVIRKGGLRDGHSGKATKDQREELEELQRLLRRGDGEKFDVEMLKGLGEGGRVHLLNRRDLEILTDRSEEAYVRAEKGLESNGDAFRTVEIKGEGTLLEALAT